MISIIIPNYNGEDLLKKNLPKVFEAVNYYFQENKQSLRSDELKQKVEIIVVDDGSTDNSVSSIKNYVSSIKDSNIQFKILQNEKNLGFSSTVNKGVKAAKGEIVVLLNTDVYPENNFLDPLIKHFNDPQVFAVGCLDKSIDLPAGKAGDGKIVLRGRGIGKWDRGFLIHSRGDINETNTLWASGGSSAFRKSIWEKFGGFNKLYNPFYWEDIDLSYRALKSGYKVLFEKKSVVYHEHTKGAIKTNYSEFQIKTITYKNQFIFVWENATDLNLQFLHLLFLPYHFIKALIRGDLPFFIGFFKAFVLLPKVIKSSLRNQRIFTKKDSEVTKDIQ